MFALSMPAEGHQTMAWNLCRDGGACRSAPLALSLALNVLGRHCLADRLGQLVGMQ